MQQIHSSKMNIRGVAYRLNEQLQNFWKNPWASQQFREMLIDSPMDLAVTTLLISDLDKRMICWEEGKTPWSSWSKLRHFRALIISNLELKVHQLRGENVMISLSYEDMVSKSRSNHRQDVFQSWNYHFDCSNIGRNGAIWRYDQSYRVYKSPLSIPVTS
jgi:hypothetical protein